MRLVVKKSLKHVIAQIIEFDKKGDKIIVSASSQELKKFGWDGPTDNTTAAYLVGLLIGKKALKNKIDSAIFDTGLHRSVKGTRVYALLKGIVDAGLSIPHSPDVFPSDERIMGKHIADYAENLKKENLDTYKKQFSVTKPEKMMEMFEKVKSNIKV